MPLTAHHYGWSRDHEPCLTVRPGAVVEFEMADPSDGQLGPASTAADIAGLDDARIPPLFGPVAVEGAAPGDAVQVAVLEAAPGPWGWTAVFPGFGLLADGFPDPALHLWELPEGAESAEFAPGIAVPLKPFPGEIGLAPAAAGLHSAVNPRRVGGNLDVRAITHEPEAPGRYRDALEVARERALDLLEHYEPEPLPDDQRRELARILAAADRELRG